ncbi:hypothetical protein Cgig2_023778 [Carnegiea gigantea]|uniref:Uncharacterized protein n=1 Tax=Carnegiea gigantea TaxID=171969 RepID=A0A9Q1JRI8_9CARY|nr:hypothetical protein Cgig2_023778 [Carnegiea gigantea]
MLLNEVERLGVLQGRALRSSESANRAPLSRGSGCTVTGFSKLDSVQRPDQERVQEPVDRKRAWRWSRRIRARPLRGRFPHRMLFLSPFYKYNFMLPSLDVRVFIFLEEVTERSVHPFFPVIMAFPPIYNTREMADHVRESFVWHWRRASRPPRSLPEDCPRFSLPEAEGAATDFELPEMVQATFYVMLLNEAVELGVVLGFMAEGLKSALAAEYVRDHFRWSLRDPMDPGPRPLPSNDHGLCPCFDLKVARRYAHDSHIPEMVSVIFYAIIIDDAAKLGLSRRLTMDVVMWAMRKLDWGYVEAWLGDNDQRLLRAQALVQRIPRGRTSSFPSFRDTVQAAEYFAHAIHIPGMVKAVFYAMVISDAARLRLIRRETGESHMSDLRKLRWDVIEAWLLFIEDKLKDAQQ